MPSGSPGISAHEPHGGRQLSTKDARQSSEGYPTKVDLSAEVRVIKNKKATETQELDRFGLSTQRNTLLLWSVGLYCLSYAIACVLRGSPPSLYSQGVGLQVG